MKNSCCFIGHRKIKNKEKVYQNVKSIVKEILEEGVRVFHFGSNSEFDDICHTVVSEMQAIYPDIIRVNYNLRSEYVVKKDEKKFLEESWSKLLKKKVELKDFEKEIISDRVFNAGKASYIERNQEMIDASNICIFYYLESYEPNNQTKSLTGSNQSKSGTKIAYHYAVKKKKTIYNVANNEYEA